MPGSFEPPNCRTCDLTRPLAALRPNPCQPSLPGSTIQPLLASMRLPLRGGRANNFHNCATSPLTTSPLTAWREGGGPALCGTRGCDWSTSRNRWRSSHEDPGCGQRVRQGTPRGHVFPLSWGLRRLRAHLYRICPRISPPGKSPGPVLTGGTPSFVWTFT